MPRPTSRAALRGPLSDLEHELMQIIWASGPATVDAVHAVVSRRRALKEVTTRTMLRRLEQKGYLTHDVDGRAFIYKAVEPPGSLAARALRQIIDRLCRGSVEELVSGIVEAQVLTDAELETLGRTLRKRTGKAPRKARTSE